MDGWWAYDSSKAFQKVWLLNISLGGVFVRRKFVIYVRVTHLFKNKEDLKIYIYISHTVHLSAYPSIWKRHGNWE